MKTLILQGNEAIVEGALAAGCRFFAGYPITPASEVAEVMSHRLPPVGGVYMQMEDEIASIMTLIGAAWTGNKVMTATSGPGYSLMQEGIGYAAVTETPCVIVNVMRGGPSTGQPTMPAQQDVMQAKYGSHGDYEPIVLCPSSVQEAFALTVQAFNFAETYRVPVTILSDEIVSHTREKITIPDNLNVIERQSPKASIEDYLMYKRENNGLLDGMPSIGQGYNILVDGQLHNESGNRAGNNADASAKLVWQLCRKITDHSSELTLVEKHATDDAKVLVVAYGSVSRSAGFAVNLARKEGIKAGLFRPQVLWPFPDEALKNILDGVEKIIVPEMNVGKVVKEVERLVCTEATQVVSLPKIGGDLHNPNEILDAIKG